MRTVTLENGQTVEVYSLTWRDVRELTQFNLTPDTITRNPAEELEDKSNEAILVALTKSLGETEADRLYDQGTMRDVLALYTAIWKETRGDPGEEKNFSTSGRSDQTPTES